MARILWKEGSLLSIETREGVFALAQMLREPYLIFYNFFSKEQNFKDVDVNNKEVLFCKAVTRQFLKESNVVKLKGIAPKENISAPKYWISIFPGSRDVVVFQGTEKERQLPILGGAPGGQLIKRDIEKGGFQDGSIVDDSISLEDDETISKYETTSLSVYPELNERLYLSYLFGKNVDPMKLLYFDKKLPLDFSTYVDAITNDAKKLGY